MSRYERRQLFETLIRLRARYRRLGPDDRHAVISIEAMLLEAETELARSTGPDVTKPADHP
jgi:hypothetical protein